MFPSVKRATRAGQNGGRPATRAGEHRVLFNAGHNATGVKFRQLPPPPLLAQRRRQKFLERAADTVRTRVVVAHGK